MKILVTGAAGFVGYHVCKKLLDQGCTVIGLDNLNDYYSTALKNDRLAQLAPDPNFTFARLDLCDGAAVNELFRTENFTHVIHLAAQAGVRYSIDHPQAYINSNITGFFHVLEACRNFYISHFIFASSSSVYGLNLKMPFSVHDNVDHPISLYAATKKSNELMAHTYSHLFGLPCTGLRFFTVYGPWNRPDMAIYRFADAITQGRPIDVYNYGRMRRDFTFAADIAEGVVRVMHKTPEPNPEWNGLSPDPGTSGAPYRIFNIGNHKSVELGYFIDVLEKELGATAKRNLMPAQPGDVMESFADISDLEKAVGYRPSTSIESGIAQFVAWYKEYHKL